MVSRTPSKVSPVIDEIRSINPSVPVTFVPCELSDQDSVRHAAQTILSNASVPAIDVLLNNAGVMAIPDYTLDKHGNELTTSSNHIGHFLLTNLLRPKLRAGGRVVNLSSLGHLLSPWLFDNPTFSPGGAAYHPMVAYGQSKTANILFTTELARRGVVSLALCPGVILETGLATHMDFEKDLPEMVALLSANAPNGDFKVSAPKNLSQGVATSLVASLDPALQGASGAFLSDCQVTEAAPYAVDAENARKLWAYTEERVGQKFEF